MKNSFVYGFFLGIMLVVWANYFDPSKLDLTGILFFNACYLLFILISLLTEIEK